MFKAVFWTAKKLGALRAWFAVGHREGTLLERCCIYPSWMLTSVAFELAFGLAHLIVWVNRKLGRLSAD